MSGWIILDKTSGMFSRTATNRVAHLFGVKKAGHIGTLDPMATGVLPIALCNATKMIPFINQFQNADKEYLFNCQFGIETDTLDSTGIEIARNNVIPTDIQIQQAISELTGDIYQIPPQYSAIHINGQRAYNIARSGQTIEIPPRKIIIYKLDYIGFFDHSWHFIVRCSTGTYVRSLARDIANKCGTLATVNMIRRTYTNGFDIKKAVTLDFLENLVNNGGNINSYLMPVDFGLGDIPVLNLGDKDAVLYKNGGFVRVIASDGFVRVYNKSEFIGVGIIKENQLRPKRTI